MYKYKAFVERVIDGDTAEVIFDLGFNLALFGKIRLKGVNAPEVKGETAEAGKKATEFLRGLIEGKTIFARTYGKDKYGRWLADVYVDGEYVNKKLIDSGNAKPYMIRKQQPKQQEQKGA